MQLVRKRWSVMVEYKLLVLIPRQGLLHVSIRKVFHLDCFQLCNQHIPVLICHR